MDEPNDPQAPDLPQIGPQTRDQRMATGRSVGDVVATPRAPARPVVFGLAARREAQTAERHAAHHAATWRGALYQQCTDLLVIIGGVDPTRLAWGDVPLSPFAAESLQALTPAIASPRVTGAVDAAAGFIEQLAALLDARPLALPEGQTRETAAAQAKERAAATLLAVALACAALNEAAGYPAAGPRSADPDAP